MIIFLMAIITSVRSGPRIKLNSSEYYRTIQGELVLNIEVHTQHTENRNIIKAPIVLHYNINNLKIFRADTKKYISLFKKEKPSLDIPGTSRSFNEKGKKTGGQAIYVEEFSRGYEEIGGERRMVTEKYVRGTTNRGIDFILTIPNFIEAVTKNPAAFKYVMMLRDVKGSAKESAESEGYQRLFIPGMGEQIITYGLHAEFSLDQLVHDGIKEKTKLPEIDGKKLIDFLLKPAGFTVFELRGETEFTPESGSGKAFYYGSLMLKADLK